MKLKQLQWLVTGFLVAFAAPWIYAQTPTFFPNLRVGTTLQIPAAAPASPLDGQVWTTTTGLFARINGVTVGPYSTGGVPGGMNTQVQFNDSGVFNGDAGLTFVKGTGDLTNSGHMLTGTGSNAAPAHSFGIDADTGLYRVGANTWGLSGGGTLGLQGDTASLTASLKLNTLATAVGGAGLNLPHGTAPGAPTNGDLWTTTAGLFARINGSTVGPFIGSSGVAFPLQAPASTAAPQYTFTGDTDTGIYESSGDVMVLTTGANNLVTLSVATLSLGVGGGPININASQMRFVNSTAGTPQLGFDNDRDTGIYYDGTANTTKFSANGVYAGQVDTTGFLTTLNMTTPSMIVSAAGGDIIRLSDTSQGADAKHTLIRTGTGGRYLVQTATDATPSTPSKNIISATRTGAAVATVDLGNSTDNPTFSVNAIDMTPLTGTFTVNFDAACSTTPSVTFNYYVTGPQVTIAPASTSGFSCTGDANTFSTTAADVPAILRPSSTAVQSSPMTGVAQDNGAAATFEILINSTGTMNLMNCTTVTSCLTNTWTASGTRNFVITSLRPQFTYYKH